MLFRELGNTGEKVSILGFGCMRLPTINEQEEEIDEKKATEMLKYAIDNGVNYLDTAYPYHRKMSEPFLGKALQGGYREKVYLATKLPSWEINTREDMDRYLNEQLQRLQTEYIDFYLIHGLNDRHWEKLGALGVCDFLDSALADGRIKYAGFSFHDNVETFKEIVDSYQWDFCQIQYNYLDENYQAGKEGLDYAAERGLGVIIMEPLRGGKLVTGIPQEAQEVWDLADSQRTPAEWAFRFLWDNPKVDLVLSGMSAMEQVKENIKIAEEGYPDSLTDEEKKAIHKVKEIYQSKIRVNCTGCKYCMPCPEGVSIPDCFTHFNNASIFNDHEGAKKYYHAFLNEENWASKCIKCRKCEKVCPQNIIISEVLQEVKESFEE